MDRPDSIIGTTPPCLDPLITINCKNSNIYNGSIELLLSEINNSGVEEKGLCFK